MRNDVKIVSIINIMSQRSGFRTLPISNINIARYIVYSNKSYGLKGIVSVITDNNNDMTVVGRWHSIAIFNGFLK